MNEDRRIVLALVAIGALARLIPHPWNFTPMMAIGFYAGTRSSKLRTGIYLTLLALLLSDAVLGFYGGMWYVLAASLVPVLLGRLAARWGGSGAIIAGALLSSLSFLSSPTLWFGRLDTFIRTMPRAAERVSSPPFRSFEISSPGTAFIPSHFLEATL